MTDTTFSNDYNLSSKLLIKTTGTEIPFYVTPRYEYHYVACEYESHSIRLVKRFLKQDGLFVDIGSHYGYYSCVAAHFRNAEIIAVEAVPENHQMLLENLKLNNARTLKTYNAAASNEVGTIDFKVVEASDSASIYGHPLAKTLKKISLPTVVMDDVLHGTRPSFIKIDVEGHEIPVLKGMKKTLLNNTSVSMLIEFNPKCQILAGHKPEELLSEIISLGFDLYFVDESSCRLSKLNDVRTWETLVEGNGYCNLLCLPKNSSSLVTFYSHSAQLAGAERSLLETVLTLQEHHIFSHVVLPQNGPLEAELIEKSIPYDIVKLDWWAGLSKRTSKQITVQAANSLHNMFEYLPNLKKINPDLIYSNTSVSPWGAITAKVLHKPHIWHVREYGELDHQLSFDLDYTESLRFIDDNSDMILANSQSIAQHIMGYKTKHKPVVVYNSVEVAEKLQNEKLPSPFRNKESLKICVVGTVHRGKNQLEALEALKILITDKKQAELLILGQVADDTYLAELQTFVSENKLQKQVKFLDFVENPYPYMQAADIVLIPSKKEAYGRTAVEALLLKKIVIASDGGGTAEIIEDGVTGFVYHGGEINALVKIINSLFDDRKRKIISENGFKSLKKFNSRAINGARLADYLKQTVANYKDSSSNLDQVTLRILSEQFKKIAAAEGEIIVQKDKVDSLHQQLEQHKTQLVQNAAKLAMLADTEKNLQLICDENERIRSEINQYQTAISAQTTTLQMLMNSKFFKIWQLFNKCKKILS